MVDELVSDQVAYCKVLDDTGWPDWASRQVVAEFLHTNMRPYEDSLKDIDASFDYAFSAEERAGGFVLLAAHQGELCGALVLLRTGMGGYVPENLLLFVAVAEYFRNRGLGEALLRRCLDECHGAIKLHLDFGNVARRLYEKLGFIHRYDEMRLLR